MKRVRRLVRELAAATGVSTTPQATGDKWESRFQSLARQRGLRVDPSPGRISSYDCVVNGYRVQCKSRARTSRRTIRLSHNAVVHRNSKRPYLRGEFDVLALRYGGKTYIIPEEALLSATGGTLINDFAPERFDSYTDYWVAFEGSGAIAIGPKQLTFWERKEKEDD